MHLFDAENNRSINFRLVLEYYFYAIAIDFDAVQPLYMTQFFRRFIFTFSVRTQRIALIALIDRILLRKCISQPSTIVDDQSTKSRWTRKNHRDH